MSALLHHNYGVYRFELQVLELIISCLELYHGRQDSRSVELAHIMFSHLI